MTNPSDDPSAGKWPRALRRFSYDLMTKSKAPANDGVVAPIFATPDWIDEVAAQASALDMARRAREGAEMRARTAEEKASRLVQVALALLTVAVALAAYQLRVASDHSWPWFGLALPVIVSVGGLHLTSR